MANILLASAGEEVRLWQLPDLTLEGVKNGTNANVTHCCCSSNGHLVAYAHEEQGVNVASLQDKELPVIEIPTACEQSSVMFNGNSRYLVSGGMDCVINIWDIKSRTSKRAYKDHINPVTFCVFNYNDNVIASSSDHGEILITNVQSGMSSEPLVGPDTQAIRSLSYSHFSRSLLAGASESGAVDLWDTKERKLLKSFIDHKAPATGLAFSPLNDMLLCSTGLDKRVIFYDVLGKKTVKTINTEGPVTCCDFMHDGCTVAVGTASGHLYMFDLRQGSTPVKVMPAHKTSVRSVSFQKIPKEKSSRRLTDESKSSNTSLEKRNQSQDSIGERDYNTLPSSKTDRAANFEQPSNMYRENLVKTKSSSTTNLYNPRDTTTTASMMPGRENSTLALNRVLKENKTPDVMSAIPPKAAKLMGDEIFSPIPIDPSIQSKKPAMRQKSGKTHDVRPQSVSIDHDEPVRPAFFRSKSGGLSKFSVLNRSSDDLKRTKDSEKTDKEDGKKSGLLGFKSPFKKKTPGYNKYSDESETSSIESFSIIDERSNTLGIRRGKNDRLSDRSNDSGGRPQDNGRYTDANAGDHPNSDNNKSPSSYSGDLPQSLPSNDIFRYGNASGGGQHLQVDFIHRMIDEALEENRAAVHSDMVNLQVEMLRQMEIQKEQIRQMMQHYSINDELVAEIDRLRAENERLRTKY